MVGGQAILFVKRPRNYSFFELETETGRLIIGPSPISLWGWSDPSALGGFNTFQNATGLRALNN